MTVSGQYAYLTAAADPPAVWVGIYDVSNPATPVTLGTISSGGFTRVAAWDDHAFLAATTGVFDVSDPRAPVALDPLWYSGGNDIAVNAGNAYVIFYTNSFRIFNVSNPTNTACVWSSGWQPFPTRVLVSGNFAYLLLDGINFISIYDVSNPTNATLSGWVPPSGYFPNAAAVLGNFVYVACYPGLKIYSLGVPLPSLSIDRLKAGNAIALKWPTPTPAFAVQQTGDLKVPHWVTLTNTPTVVASQNQVTIAAPSAMTFYRLASQ